MKLTLTFGSLCFAALAFAKAPSAAATHYLTIGDEAPKLDHVTWIKNSPGGDFEKGKVYVVEFWATWCTPCKENIPHLTELAKKYAGQASIAGIDIWESTDKKDTDYSNRVRTFVTKEGSQMDYVIGFDDPASHIANTWMKAAGEGGIPESFVIGRDGRIAWMGHAQGLAEVLPQVIAGTFDVAAAKSSRETEVNLVRPVKEAMDEKKYAKAIQLMDSLSVGHPTMVRYYQYDRYTATAHLDLAKTKQMTDDILKESNGEIGAYQMVCSVYASDPGLSQPAYRYGMGLIKDALAKKDREYMFLSMAGGVSLKLHDKANALIYDRQAVEAAEMDSHAPKPFVEFLKRNLADLESGKTK